MVMPGMQREAARRFDQQLSYSEEDSADESEG